jgi:hypothetical protein
VEGRRKGGGGSDLWGRGRAEEGRRKGGRGAEEGGKRGGGRGEEGRREGRIFGAEE